MTTQRCYAESAKVKIVQKNEAKTRDNSSLDPRLHDSEKEGKPPKPVDDLKEVMIGLVKHQKIKIGVGLTADMEEQLVKFLTDNVDVFAWTPRDMVLILITNGHTPTLITNALSTGSLAMSPVITDRFNLTIGTSFRPVNY